MKGALDQKKHPGICVFHKSTFLVHPSHNVVDSRLRWFHMRVPQPRSKGWVPKVVVVVVQVLLPEQVLEEQVLELDPVELVAH